MATGGDYFCQSSPRWAIPRFVCGEDWKTPRDFEAILVDAVDGSVRESRSERCVQRPLLMRVPSRMRNLRTRCRICRPRRRAGRIPREVRVQNASHLMSLPLPQHRNNETAPFFLVGCVRSGTTLLRNLLRQHPNLESPEETHFFRWPHSFGTGDFNHIQRITRRCVLIGRWMAWMSSSILSLGWPSY